MTRRTASVEAIWQRLLIVFVTLLVVCVALFCMGGDARVPALVLLAGNVGAYVGVPRSLGELKDQEVIDLVSDLLKLDDYELGGF